MDFLLSWATSTTTKGFFLKGLTWIDLLTIIPVFLAESLSGVTHITIVYIFSICKIIVYLSFILDFSCDACSIEGLHSTRGVFQLFRFLRVFGLLRILKAFKKVYGLSEVNRQIAQLCLTILSLIFMSAGIINLLENDLKQHWFAYDYISSVFYLNSKCHFYFKINITYALKRDYNHLCRFVDCQYSNADTNYIPSCIKDGPSNMTGLKFFFSSLLFNIADLHIFLCVCSLMSSEIFAFLFA